MHDNVVFPVEIREVVRYGHIVAIFDVDRIFAVAASLIVADYLRYAECQIVIRPLLRVPAYARQSGSAGRRPADNFPVFEGLLDRNYVILEEYEDP